MPSLQVVQAGNTCLEVTPDLTSEWPWSVYWECTKGTDSVLSSLYGHVDIQVVSVSGEELALIPASVDWSCADVARNLQGKSPLLPGHEYRLIHGINSLTDDQKIRDVDRQSSEMKLTAVVQAKASVQEDLDMALIDAAGTLDHSRVQTLLAAGASAAFIHNPPGRWGSCDARSALHVAIQRQPRAQAGAHSTEVDQWKALLQTLLEAKADANAERRKAGWGGCGSSISAFEMVLPAAMQDAGLLQSFLAAGANPNTESRHVVHSRHTNGGSCQGVLHTAVLSGNHEVVKTLLDAKANVDAARSERIVNERGPNKDMGETSLHIACKSGDVKMSALLLEYAAEVNAMRDDLVDEDGSELELVARVPDKTKMAWDGPRDPDYVRPSRCIPVQETALHIAIMIRHAGLVTLLACAGADASIPRRRGETATSTEELCGGEAPLLHALSASWPVSPALPALAGDDAPCVEAAIAALAARRSGGGHR